MSHHPARSFSHLAVCVSDLESSKRFYSEALGFIIDHDVSAGEPYGRLVELPNFKYSASFLRHEGAGVMLELLKIESPGHIGPSERPLRSPLAGRPQWRRGWDSNPRYKTCPYRSAILHICPLSCRQNLTLYHNDTTMNFDR